MVAVLCGVLGMVACGSSSGGSSGGGSTITSVSVSCSPTTLMPGQTSQCTATVSGTGSFSSSVTWSASAGSISNAGLFTAPTTNATLLVTVTATSTQDTSKSGAATVTVSPASQVSNVLPIIVDAGPSGLSYAYVNGAFATVTVCVPGTSTCQSIDHVLVDTGSEGLRLVGSVLTLNLPVQKDSSGNTIGECTQFADGYSWGAVAGADVQMAGEKATSVPIQIIGTSTLPNIPSACSSTGTGENDVQTLGANGVLGVGVFEQDCGGYCVNTTSNGFYYTCPGNTNCTQTTVALANQVQNPVWLFPQDNNGILIQLPSVPLGTGSVNPTGSLIFGIDTQSDNALGSASFYTTTPSGDYQSVTLNGQTYNDSCSSTNSPTCSYIDSGSNAWFILNAATLGVTQCSGTNSSFYCQNPTSNFQATATGANAISGTVGFSIGDADTLFNNNQSATAFVELGSPGNTAASGPTFDFGLPFFYGKSVFVVIENHSTSKGQGPAWAY